MALFENERASGRLREALAILEEDNPAGNREQRARAWSALGELYRRLQSYPASDNAFAESLALDPDDAITLSRFAFSLAERGIRLADALQYARRAANARPQDPSILDTVGWVYYRSGDDRNARSWLTRAVETGRAGPTAYEHLGDVLWRTGEKEGARQNWQRALEMNPSSDRLMQKLRSGS